MLNVFTCRVEIYFVAFHQGGSRSSKREGNRHTTLFRHKSFGLAISGKSVSEHTERKDDFT